MDRENHLYSFIDECKVCSENACQHEGQCLPNHSEKGYTCRCQPGYTGAQCESSIPCLQGTKCPWHMLPAIDPDHQCHEECLNGALCVAHEFHDFSCQCKIGFTGELCETSYDKMQGFEIMRGGYISLEAKDIGTLINITNDTTWSFDLVTTDKNTLIFWHSNSEASIYQAVFIHQNGSIAYKEKFERLEASCSVPVEVSDGILHHILFGRHQSRMFIEVDGSFRTERATDEVHPIQKHLGHLIIGGGSHVKSYTQNTFEKVFEGHILNISVDGQAVNMSAPGVSGWNVNPSYHYQIDEASFD
ncbi:hypothetical protein HELRODRAFT_187878 [Helobdella robusta]|uniref:EGF-like domain-containing protein n=1 Tax=Helobdella robusta TaxID=6412 RepID=T1FPG0_HELRO|nr:hypothetical protein HELRODRAFT_187878 [Helobdella robusta]ESO12454.1 hypothetical protein HELRODRAFT_187878 [Helobdella robusta]